MARYPPLVVGSLLGLSTLPGLSVSQSAWKLDPEKHLALMYNHMSAVVNSTIYTIGGTAVYWTPESTASSVVSENNNSAYIIKTASELSSLPHSLPNFWVCYNYSVPHIDKQTSSDSFLRALDLSKPVDFEAEFSDTAEVISELPIEIPHVKLGATWADQNTIYYWGGEIEGESIYLNGAFQNRTRKWPDPMKYYTYDLSQPRGLGTWKTISITDARGSGTLTNSPSFGEYSYAAEARKGFYLGGVMARPEFKNEGRSNTTRAGRVYYNVSSMIVFDAARNVWKNESIIAELNGLREGAMVYVAGVGEKGILVRMGGARKNEFVGVPWTLRHIGFDTVYVYDIAAGVWYRQPTTSKTKIFPETRFGGFCAGAATAPDKTSFTIYIYGGHDYDSLKEGTWALTMPYFQWLPVGSTGGPERGRSRTTCHTVGGQLAMVRGHGDRRDRGDTNSGTYFYDMTNLTWSLKYQPFEYRVPKAIYDVIGGNKLGCANLTGPVDDKGFATGLGKLFAAAANCPTSHRDSPSPSLTGTIVGGVIGGIALLAAIGSRYGQGTASNHRRS
ncbi:hypothetical protein HOY82DRAFT_535653 [Tuber indicum]|nr:hypothetical protein HOY82DRAFT_535653 [Tuber indicum]